MDSLTRRSVLAGSLFACGAALLAACGETKIGETTVEIPIDAETVEMPIESTVVAILGAWSLLSRATALRSVWGPC